MLIGGEDADVLVFVADDGGFVTDKMTDFEIVIDAVQLSGYAAPSFLTLLGSGAAQLFATEIVLIEGVDEATLLANSGAVFELA